MPESVPSQSSSGVTQQVLARHMAAVDSGDLEAVMADYAADAVLLTPEGTYRGHAQIRPMWKRMLADVFGMDARFTMIREAVEGEIAFIAWSGESKRLRIPLATDTYRVRDGKIIVQTYAAVMEKKDDR